MTCKGEPPQQEDDVAVSVPPAAVTAHARSLCGALPGRLVADWLGMVAAIHVVAALTLFSGVAVMGRMHETLGALR